MLENIILENLKSAILWLETMKGKVNNMETLFWIFFGIGMALFVATITTISIKKTREKLIHIWCNIGLSICAVICSIINFIAND